MLTRFLLIVLFPVALLMFSVPTFAQDSLDGTATGADFDAQYKSQVANWDTEYNAAKKQADKLDGDAEKAKKEIDSLNSQLGQLYSQDRNDSERGGIHIGQHVWFQGVRNDPQVEAKIQKAQADLKKDQEAYNSALTQYNNYKMNTYDPLLQTMGAEKSKMNASEQTLRQEMATLNMKLNTVQLDAKFDRLGTKFMKISDVLDKVDQKYNNAMVGTYVADTVERLLHSNALCHAMTACSAGKGNYVPNSKDMEQIFKNIDKSHLRSADGAAGFGGGSASTDTTNTH